jgi:hypothetical protein
MSRSSNRTHAILSPAPKYLAILLALLAFALVSCAKKTPETTTTTTETSKVEVSRIDLGKGMTADRRVIVTDGSFLPADTIFAAVVYAAPAPTGTVVARWTSPDGKVVGETTEIITPTPNGDAITEVHLASPAGLTPGDYKVEILSDGVVVGTKNFTVVAK